MSRPLKEVPREYKQEDDEPVDGFLSEKQQRLLANTLNEGWSTPRKFLVCTNVGIFSPLWPDGYAPDAFVSMDVDLDGKEWQTKTRSYIIEEFGKPPDIAIEIVSPTEGGEDKKKKAAYAQVGIPYYVIFNPLLLHKLNLLTIYQLRDGVYEPYVGYFFPSLGLSLKLWEGIYESGYAKWLRWFDADGNMILTGKERAEVAEKQVAEEKQRANLAEKQAEQMATMLRKMGIDPNSFKMD